MALRIVRLGSERARDEGLRVGTVRRPPRGVPKSDWARRNWYDVWLPELSPRPETLKRGLSARSEREWAAFAKAFRREMAAPEARRLLDLLAAFSHHGSFSLGCYCEVESRCHRSILRELLIGRGARLIRGET
jgi:uncharacterized protein YeaO (DUF488 family)